MPSATGEFTQPVAGLQLSLVHVVPSSQFGGGPPLQVPAEQLSLVVQKLPSSHEVPSATGVGSQVSVASLQMPMVHSPVADEQSVWMPPWTHTPDWQVSFWVQKKSPAPPSQDMPVPIPRRAGIPLSRLFQRDESPGFSGRGPGSPGSI